MNILVFGGFLGSGKTSVLLQLALHIVQKEKETVAIVENEVGEVGIDDKVIAAQGLKVKGIFAGCVCCQITGQLLEAVEEIHKTVGPDWLIIEATGLAVPSKIVDLISTYYHCYNALKTIVIVDASRWEELFEVVEPLMVSQVKSADTVLVNKIDLVGEECRELLLKDLNGFNSGAKFCLTTALVELPEEILQEMVEV